METRDAALRTLTRPVEDEQTAKWLRRFRAYGGEFEEAASLLALLVRELQTERDAAAILGAELPRAEQEAARLRDDMKEARRLIGFATAWHTAEAARVLERALAAAAGTEEP